MKILRKTIVETSACGYPKFRIPGLTVTDRGTILCTFECRASYSDWSVIDLGLRISRDGGKTFAEREILASGQGIHTMNNPVFIADGDTVHLVYMQDYKRAFYRQSTDEGDTWSPAREITDAFMQIRDRYPWTCIAAGPGHGTLLKSGRLVVPIWLSSCPEDSHRHSPSVSSVLYSDDHGKTWRLGEIIPSGWISNPNESAMAQLPNGKVLINMRNTSETKRRCVSVSEDGVSGWCEAYFDHQLIDPICAGGMCASPQGILFTNCASRTDREKLTLRRSADGKTWDSGLTYEETGGYSDVYYSRATGTAFVFYEAEDSSYLKLAEIELS